MKIWIDDIRPASHGFIHCYSTNQAIKLITLCDFYDSHSPILNADPTIELISIDHDSGDYEGDGGDYINVLNWLEKHKLNCLIHLHTMNPVGAENMRRIIRRNGWTEVK